MNVRFIQNNKYLVACTWEDILRVWDVEKKSEVLKYNVPNYSKSFKLTKDHKYAIVYGGYGIYDLSLDTVKTDRRKGPKLSDGTIVDMDLSTDNEFYAFITEKRILQVLDFETKYDVVDFKLPEPYSNLYFTSNSEYLVAYGEQSITVWRTSNWSEVAHIPYEAKIYYTESTSDSKYIVLVTADGAEILEIETSIKVADLSDYSIKQFAISQGNRYLFAYGEDKIIHIFNLETNSKVSEIETDGSINHLKLSNDQRHLITLNDHEDIEVWEIVP